MKKICILFGLLLSLFLVGCSQDTTVPTPNPDHKAQIKEIQAVDESGTLIQEVSEYQAITSYKEYSHSNIHVKAIYDDDSTKDVTAFATFSKVDLSKTGKVDVKITYMGCETSYILNIIENKIRSITLNTSLAKVVYKVGERFSSTGLLVRAKYSDDTISVIQDYEIEVSDRFNVKQDISHVFTKTGHYDVIISSQGVKSYYEIIVYSNAYSLENEFDLSEYGKDLEYDASGTYSYKAETEIFKDDYSTLSVNKSVFRSKKRDGSDISLSYDGNHYTKALELSSEEDAVLTLAQPTEILLYVGGINGRGVIFYQEEETYSAIGNVNENVSLLYISLPAGVYKMLTNLDTINIYSMVFNYVDGEAPIITDIRVDTSQTKLNYNIHEGLETENLKVYSILSDLTEHEISLADIKFSLSLNGNSKTALDEAGTYTVTIQYNTFSTSFEIQVKETKTFQSLKLDTSAAKLVFENEVFSFEGIKIFGVVDGEVKDELPLADFAFTLILDEKIVTDFTVAGTYTVRISYLGEHIVTGSNTLNYTVTYTTN